MAAGYRSSMLLPASPGREILTKMMNWNQNPLQRAGASYAAVAALLLLRTTTLTVVAVVVGLAFSADDCRDDCSLVVAAAKRPPPCSGRQLRVDCNTWQPASCHSAPLHVGLAVDSCRTGAAASGRAAESASASALPSGATSPCAASQD